MTPPRHGEHPSIIFLGGVFLPSQRDTILKHSRGVVQNAADALQKAFLRGFSEHADGKVKLVNLPIVGSYPRLYDKFTFPACEDTLPPGIKARGEGFLNLRFVRFWSRFISAVRGLRRAGKGIEAPVVVVYSAHLPFLAAARLMRIVRRDVFLCAILPDLPEFMGVGGRTSHQPTLLVVPKRPICNSDVPNRLIGPIFQIAIPKCPAVFRIGIFEYRVS